MSAPDLFATLPREVLEYLRRLRAGLAPLPESEREEIVRETAAHVLDRAESAGDPARAVAVLAELGDPEDYAARFVDNYRISSALASGSPLALAGGVVRGLGRGLWAFAGGLVVLVLYSLAAGFIAVGALKPVLPERTGLFVGPQLLPFALGIFDHPPAPGMREVLGYWVVPLAIGAGALVMLLANRFARAYLRSLRR
jgi:hypothetical protein